MKKILFLICLSSKAHAISAIICDQGPVKDGNGLQEIIGRLNEKVNQKQMVFNKQVFIDGKFEEKKALLTPKGISAPAFLERAVTSSLKNITVCVSVNE